MNYGAAQLYQPVHPKMADKTSKKKADQGFNPMNICALGDKRGLD
jgi:hypothetical protein